MSNIHASRDARERDGDQATRHENPPSNGYFAQRQDHMPGDDPAVRAEQAKARGAEADGYPVDPSAIPPSPPSPVSSVRSSVWSLQTGPILDAGPAPPDYAAAVASRARQQHPELPAHAQEPQPDRHELRNHEAGSYGTMRQEQTPTSAAQAAGDRQRSLGSESELTSQNAVSGTQSHGGIEREWPFGNRNNPFTNNFPFGTGGSPFDYLGQPQSMQDVQRQQQQTAPQQQESGDDDGGEEQGLLSRRRKGGRKRRWRRIRACCCSPAAVLNLIFGAALVGIIILLVRLNRVGNRSDSPSQDKPAAGGDGGESNSTDPFPAHPENGQCEYKYFSGSISFEFSHADNFSFTEMIEPSTFVPGGISGNVWILPAPPEQTHPIQGWVSYATSEPWHVTDMSYFFEAGSIELRFPPHNRMRGRRPCMDIGMTFYVKDNVQSSTWSILTGNLNVEVDDMLFVRNSIGEMTRGPRIGTMNVNTVRGDVKMPYWDSRRTIIDTDSGSVSGTYALRDLLSISTHSGTVSISVEPQLADPVNAKPAEFQMESHSASVHANFPIYGDLPDRDYRTRVSTHSGTVSGNYLLGSTAAFSSQSGTLSLGVLPCFAQDMDATLHTDSGSASTSMYLLPPYRIAGAKMRSSHRSNSGAMSLVYPDEWDGQIEGHSKSGGISLRGKDVKVYFDGSYGPAGRHIIAHKGYGGSKLDFSTNSGSVSLKVGYE
ncbi:hypothetical protein BAUCODRAFT_182983 [Baudoinia panamericana UAMH 10762]|uniref:Adhesin domain-containing protein n=1 Tax=Baudoinia panamericana (strain UAMH 10762) TaxID=717646 RepID=M2N9C5_BAUPA|nr:uncharacterized protein BAUCODRAFT_182983 [Baudoinia panamericana UAMH 10762]EMD00779.1 hypothetical protein BAUCODRAFT_182983 [Baudoinia panamericana UAMH 10762]